MQLLLLHLHLLPIPPILRRIPPFPSQPHNHNHNHNHNLLLSGSSISYKLSSSPSPFSSHLPPIYRTKTEATENTTSTDPHPEPTTTTLQHMKSILLFSLPATALWICSPLMSLLDTAIVGRNSSLELAALGPATVLCDNISFIFMFLSIATSNIIATSMAKENKKGVQHNLSILLFLGLAMGSLMSILMKFFSPFLLKSFTGSHNSHLLPLANSYVQIRSLAWPAVLLGWVAQSASIGMRDSYRPMKALILSTVVNLTGHLVLCTWLDRGMAGAAWATVVANFVAAYLMLGGLEKKGYSGLSGLVVPSWEEVVKVVRISAPVIVTMGCKVGFYSGMIYMATSMGTKTVAAHQVMIQLYSMCVVWGEPLSQTAQAFMPGMMYGGGELGREKARGLMKGLLGMGVVTGLVVGGVGTGVLWGVPGVFTKDEGVRREMGRVLVEFFMGLVVTPCTHCVEGTLLAGRDGGFLSVVMGGCLVVGMGVLVEVRRRGFGLVGCWVALVVFQWGRFGLGLARLVSKGGVV